MKQEHCMQMPKLGRMPTLDGKCLNFSSNFTSIMANNFKTCFIVTVPELLAEGSLFTSNHFSQTEVNIWACIHQPFFVFFSKICKLESHGLANQKLYCIQMLLKVEKSEE